MPKVILPATLAALLGACSSGPSTHMLLPTPATTPAIQHLAKQDGAIAIVITTQGEETALIVKADQPGTLSGNIVEKYATGPAETSQVIALSFDSLAAIYYTEPASGRLSLQKRLPWKGRFPEPPAVGTAERALSCQALDTELARTEALRWVARSHDATPYTGAEKVGLHAKHAAVDVGLAALVIVAVAAVGPGGGGGGGCWTDCGPPNDGAWHVDLEGYRWAVSAIDEREEGLLRLKKQNQCTGRATVKSDSTDLAILERLDAWKAQQSSARIDEHALLAKRTEAFDQLGPKVVPDILAGRALQAAAQLQAAQQLLGPDEHVERILSDARWFGEKRFAGAEVPYGDIVVTDKSFLFANLAHYAASLEKQQTSVHMPYAQLATVDVAHWGVSKYVMIRTKDGHTQYFQLEKPSSVMVDRESTQAVADLLRAKVELGAAGSKKQPETR